MRSRSYVYRAFVGSSTTIIHVPHLHLTSRQSVHHCHCPAMVGGRVKLNDNVFISVDYSSIGSSEQFQVGGMLPLLSN